MKGLAEYQARAKQADEPKNPTREDIMKQKSLYCTPDNPKPALIPSHGSAESAAREDDHKKRDPKVEMDKVFSHYLASNPAKALHRKRPELEVRFNGLGGAPLTKLDYDAVIQHLYAAGFTTDNPNGLNILRIQPEYVDNRKGITKLSNIRAEVCGADLIQEYCKTNSIQSLLNMPSTLSAASNKIVFTQKTQIPIDEKDQRGRKFSPVDNEDFRFRIGYQYENEFSPNNELVRSIVETKRWADSKKVFRHLNRVRFSHPDLPVFADITILRTSAKSGRVMIPQYTIQEARVFQQEESYEVELEIDNGRVGEGMEYGRAAVLLADVRKAIRVVLSAIQGTNYPVGESEMKHVIHLYQRLIQGEKAAPTDNLNCSFIGPSSKTLQMENIVEWRGEVGTRPNVPNLRYGYTVTDKADGDRKMMLVDDSGKIYFIDMNMRIQGTGAMTAEKKLHFSLFDGEHIKYDKTGKFINLFAVFDVYYVNKRSYRELPLIHIPDDGALREEAKKPDNNTRWYWMNLAIEALKPFSILDKYKPRKNASGEPDAARPCSIRVQCKEFYAGVNGGTAIFDHCKSILSKSKDGLFEYNTDGLIFTPAEYGVGGKPELASGPLYKHTWDRSFKWKPAEFNTVDFLVRLKKDVATGRDFVGTEYENGNNMTEAFSMSQYKTIVLHCGFDEKKHGYVNPFQQLVDGEFAKKTGYPTNEDEEVRPESTYSARPFAPTNPADPKACFCNVQLTNDGGYMQTEDGDIFEENMIVEFRYDGSRKGAWRWIPIRVRYDKTAESSSLCSGAANRKGGMRRKKQSFGNDFSTADSNWFSIHNPITEKMLKTGDDIPQPDSVGEEIYYTRKSIDSTTRGLRDFHNLYVKMRLIGGVANRKDTLIDYAVGKAGDLSKWRSARLGFVFGVDVSKDNIMNRVDGACSRYLTEASKHGGMFDALFLHGNSAQNIRSGDAFEGYKEKNIARAVFGEGPKVRADLGETVYKAYGIAREGFNISSCQFAVHYFFENVRSIHNFARNVSECTRVGGIFVGTCWDGKTVFNKLRSKTCGDSLTLSRQGERVFQITKMYDETEFPDDELSLGYSISVFQESIGQHIIEYLVNFEFLRRVMENYGFVLLNREEATQFGFPSGGTGMFESLYHDMMSEVSREETTRYGTAPQMTHDEKFISFLNRYFIFRKVRNVAAERITRVINEKLPSREASRCLNADRGYQVPVTLSSVPLVEDEEIEDSVEKIANSFQKREELTAKEQKVAKTKEPVAKTKEPVAKPKEPVEKPKEPVAVANKKEENRGFLRPLGNTKITIRVYEPPAEEGPQEVVDLPIEPEGPAIQLVPKTVVKGKTVKIPNRLFQK